MGTPEDIARAVAQGKREIREDVAAGIVPATVRGFDELHDYVDANMYAGLCDDDAIDRWGGHDAWIEEGNKIIEALHAWIVAGMPDD